MFRLSKAAEYAIRGVLYLSLQEKDKASGVDEIARIQDIPVAYLAKIFQTLAKKGFVRSFRGADGGFKLAKSPKDISLVDVIEVVEGPIFLNDCLIHSGYCSKDDLCPVHDLWKEAQKRFLDYLDNSSFEELAVSAKGKEKTNILQGVST